MIPLLCLTLQTAKPCELIEVPSPAESKITLEAYVRLPELSNAHLYVLTKATAAAVRQTSKFPPRSVRAVFSPGYGPRYSVTGNGIRIGFTVEPDNWKTGLSLMQSILTEPVFLSDLDREPDATVKSPIDRFYQIGDVFKRDFNPRGVLPMWYSLVNSKTVTVAISGPFATGEPTKRWESYASGWTNSGRNNLQVNTKTEFPPARNTDDRIVMLESASLQEPIAPLTLAATILGVGRDSILFRLCREEMKISYQQEAIVLPDRKNWRLRVGVFTDQKNTDPVVLLKLKDELKKSINALSESDVQRALGAAKGALQYQQRTLPIIIGNPGELPSDPASRLHFDLVWRTIEGKRFEPSSLISDMNTVGLEKVKSLLNRFIDSCELSIY